jgi:hypothetical protein
MNPPILRWEAVDDAANAWKILGHCGNPLAPRFAA